MHKITDKIGAITIIVVMHITGSTCKDVVHVLHMAGQVIVTIWP